MPTASPEPPRKRPAKAAGRSAATPADTPEPAGSNPPAKKPARTPGRQTAKKAAKKAAKETPSAPPVEATSAEATPDEATPATSPGASATTPVRDDAPPASAQPPAGKADNPVDSANNADAAAGPAKKAARPAAKAAARKATTAEKAETAVPAPAARDTAQAAAPAQVPATEQVQATAQVRDTEQAVPTPLWATVKAAPGYAPELLALAAVAHLGPPARENLTWLRETYPTATTTGLARIATSRSVRLARTQGAVAGLLGPEAVLAQTAALLWNQARMVLDVAAAYGRDPADPERAAELLTLQGVHPDLATARGALAAARGAGEAGSRSPAGDRAPQVTLPLVRVAGRALLRMLVARRAARLVPGAGAVLTGILDGRATEQLATRAVRWYSRSAQER